MQTKQPQKRLLFSNLVNFAKNIFQDTDPLFAKYSRKIYRGRKYSALNETNRNSDTAENINRVVPVTSGLAAYTGQWSDREAIHLLKRTGFGFKKAHLDQLIAPGMNANSAVNMVLNVSNTAPNPPVNNYQPDYADENSLAYGASWVDSFFTTDSVGDETNSRRIESLQAWMVGNALNHDITIKEKMMQFWYHFIPIDIYQVRQAPYQYINQNSTRIVYDYFKVFRDLGTGNFKTLIRQMATHPAMMFYLNNQANTKTAPDENFAREIMELFTLGKGPNSLYTQADVIAAAKLLTGWRVTGLNTANPTTAFVAARHETSNKQFSAFFNNTVINNAGASELDSFINMIFSKDEVVSQYICRRLYRYFVYYDIDANIETNVIVPLAQHFVANNWNIMPVLDKLFKSQHFFDMANRGVYIKSPFDLMLGFLRTLNVNYNIADPSNHNAQYSIWLTVHYLMFNMEQGMATVPNVSGWQAFYQNPSFHEYWINSNSIQKRFAYIAYAFYGIDFNKNGYVGKLKADSIEFVKQFSDSIIEDPNSLINESIKYLLPIDLSTTQKNGIKIQTLLSGQTSDYYWTDAWLEYKNNPTNNMFKLTVSSRLDNLFLTIIQLAEFQLM
jgi:uncharacterized protein (DUF1800 family)